MKTLMGVLTLIVGVCLAVAGCDGATNLFLVLTGIGLMIVGLMLCPSEVQEVDRVRQTTLAWRRGCMHSHGFGECSGDDCRL